MKEQTIEASTYALFNHGKDNMIVPEVALLIQDIDEDKPKQTSLYIHKDNKELLQYSDNSNTINQF